jgi:hypothetical protein
VSNKIIVRCHKGAQQTAQWRPIAQVSTCTTALQRTAARHCITKAVNSAECASASLPQGSRKPQPVAHCKPTANQQCDTPNGKHSSSHTRHLSYHKILPNTACLLCPHMILAALYTHARA